MNEGEPRLGQEFLDAVAKNFLPCGIQHFEIPIETGDAQQVQRKLKQAAQLFMSGHKRRVRIFLLLRARHSAISNSEDEPFAHMRVREEKGIRPGGFGLLMTPSDDSHARR